MKRDRAEAARDLGAKAENDLKAARILLSHDGPLDTVSFHLQQAAEKVLKGCLTLHGIEYPFTHDLGDLLLLAVGRVPALAKYKDSLPPLTDFAVAVRYDDRLLPEKDEVIAYLESVEALKRDVFATFPNRANPSG